MSDMITAEVKALAEAKPGKLFVDQDGDVCIDDGRQFNLIFCPATDDGDIENGWPVLNPDVVAELVTRFNAAPDLARTVIALHAQLADAEGRVATRLVEAERFYIDCEFDGHNGPLLSIAMVREDGLGMHVKTDAVAEDPWVIANVVPLLDAHNAQHAFRVRPLSVGTLLRNFIGDCQRPVIIADSPVDIARFCQAISTGEDGGWASANYSGMTFIVENVDCYPTTLPGAVRHNAWWDAMALRAALALAIPPADTGEGQA